MEWAATTRPSRIPSFSRASTGVKPRCFSESSRSLLVSATWISKGTLYFTASWCAARSASLGVVFFVCGVNRVWGNGGRDEIIVAETKDEAVGTSDCGLPGLVIGSGKADNGLAEI